MNMLCKTAMIAVFFVSAHPMNNKLIENESDEKRIDKYEEAEVEGAQVGLFVELTQETAHWLVRASANLKGVFSQLSLLKQKTRDPLVMSFPELPHEMQEEVLIRLVSLYTADAPDFKRIFGRLSLLNQVSRTFSSRLKSVCSKKGTLEELFVSSFASPVWALLSKKEHIEILLDIARKIVFQNDWPIKGAEKALVDLADDFKRNGLTLLAGGVDTIATIPEKLRVLLIPALLDACPAIAHLALYQCSRYDNMIDALFKVSESEEYSNRSLNNPSSKYRLLLQEMLGRFPTDDLRQAAIDAYSSKGVTLEVSWGINEHNVSSFNELLANDFLAGTDLMGTISKMLDTIAITKEIKQIWIAARDGDVKAARELLKRNSFSAHAYEGIIGTALCLACFNGNSAIAQEFVAIPYCIFTALLFPALDALRRGHTAFIKVLLTQNLLSMNEREMFTVSIFRAYLEQYADYDRDLLSTIASILECPQLATLIQACKNGNLEEIKMAVSQDLISPGDLIVRGMVLVKYAHLDGLKMLIETAVQKIKDNKKNNELFGTPLCTILGEFRQLALQNGHQNIDDYLNGLHIQH